MGADRGSDVSSVLQVDPAGSRFDQLTRAIAHGLLTRGQILRLAGGAIVSLAITTVGMPDRVQSRRKKKRKKKRKGASSNPPPPPPPPPRPTSPPPAQGTSPYESILASGRVWFEHDWDEDIVCYSWKFNIQSGGLHTVIRTGYPADTGFCDLGRAFPPSFGAVWSVSGNILTFRSATGYTEQITLGTYNPSLHALPINRSWMGNSIWLSCDAPDNPFYGLCPG
jgi:hypothetical protein